MGEDDPIAVWLESDEGGVGKSELLSDVAVVYGRLCRSDSYKSLELHESDSRKNSGKRPAGAGLFILFGRWSGKYDPIYLAAAFVSLPPDGRRHGTDGQDHYRCPWSILRREGAGRSWVTRDTSNLPGVEQIKANEHIQPTLERGWSDAAVAYRATEHNTQSNYNNIWQPQDSGKT